MIVTINGIGSLPWPPILDGFRLRVIRVHATHNMMIIRTMNANPPTVIPAMAPVDNVFDDDSDTKITPLDDDDDDELLELELSLLDDTLLLLLLLSPLLDDDIDDDDSLDDNDDDSLDPLDDEDDELLLSPVLDSLLELLLNDDDDDEAVDELLLMIGIGEHGACPLLLSLIYPSIQ